MSETTVVICPKCGTQNTVWSKSGDAVFGRTCGHCGAEIKLGANVMSDGSLERGIEQAAAGELHDLGTFEADYVDTEMAARHEKYGDLLEKALRRPPDMHAKLCDALGGALHDIATLKQINLRLRYKINDLIEAQK
jgi:NMD protein affecting ribosome stability and mRNA decay